ncbi:hypothetical protein ABBQ32_008723 [Trebouxia sp. C0010 RCD-2024]
MLHIKYKQLNASGGGLIVYATWSLTFQTCCVCCTGTIQGNGASAIGSFQNSDAYSIVSTNEGDHISVNVNDNACVGNYYVTSGGPILGVSKEASSGSLSSATVPLVALFGLALMVLGSLV